MSQGADRHDDTILKILDSLGDGAPQAVGGVEDADPALEREYRELLGLMAYENEAATPSQETLDGLLAQIEELEGAPGEPAGEIVPMPRRIEESAPSPQVWGGEFVPSQAVASPWSALSIGLAAMLALCLLGLAYLGGQLQERSTTIAKMELDLRALPGEQSELRTMRTELVRLQRRMTLITNIARQAYPMRATLASETTTSKASGVVFVCGAHQQWYLNLRGLEAPEPGYEYRMWFMTDEGPVDGGALPNGPGVPAELEASTMPLGTKGFAVTMEKKPQDPTQFLPEPAGQMIVLGDRPVEI